MREIGDQELGVGNFGLEMLCDRESGVRFVNVKAN